MTGHWRLTKFCLSLFDWRYLKFFRPVRPPRPKYFLLFADLAIRQVGEMIYSKDISSLRKIPAKLLRPEFPAAIAGQTETILMDSRSGGFPARVSLILPRKLWKST